MLLAGGDIVNTGNIFANYTVALAGIRATASTATVNGVAGTTVNRLFNVVVGSQLIVNASGNLDIVAPSGSQPTVSTTTVSRLWDVGGALAGMFTTLGSDAAARVGVDLIGPSGNFFEFPGGIAFKAGGPVNFCPGFPPSCN